MWLFCEFLLSQNHLCSIHLCPVSSKLSFLGTSILLSGSSVKDSEEVKAIQDTLVRVLDSSCYSTNPDDRSRSYEKSTYTLRLIRISLIRSWWQGEITRWEKPSEKVKKHSFPTSLSDPGTWWVQSQTKGETFKLRFHFLFSPNLTFFCR